MLQNSTNISKEKNCDDYNKCLKTYISRHSTLGKQCHINNHNWEYKHWYEQQYYLYTTYGNINDLLIIRCAKKKSRHDQIYFKINLNYITTFYAIKKNCQFW